LPSWVVSLVQSPKLSIKTFLADAGFNDVLIVDNKYDLNIYLKADDKNAASSTACCILAPAGMNALPPDYDANELAAACKIYAVKGDALPGSVPSKPALLRWWDAYPKAKSTSFPDLTVEEVAKLIRDSGGKESNFAVIDVRKTDHAGGHVRGSYNFHAQTFYDDLPAFYEKFKSTEKVIFYCQSSNGRAPRCEDGTRTILTSAVVKVTVLKSISCKGASSSS